MTKYKIMTKDEQWTIKDNMTEKEVIEYWMNNIHNSVASLDRIIQDKNGNDYVIALDCMRLEKKSICYY